MLLALLLSLSFPDTLAHWDGRIRDQLLRLRYRMFGTQVVSPHVIHVVLNDTSQRALLLPSWDREVFGRAIDILQQTNVRVVACDVLLRDPSFARNDELLLSAVPAPHPVLFPLLVYPEGIAGSWARDNDPEADGQLLQRCLLRPGVVRGGNAPAATRVVMPFADLARLARALGHINASPDRDGVTRRVNLLYRFGDGYVPALSLRAVIEFYGVAERDIEVWFGKHIVLRNARIRHDYVKDIVIPIDDLGRIIVNFPGPWGDSFLSYPLHKVLSAGDDPAVRSQLYDLVDGALVLVSDVSSTARDYGPGIFEPTYPLSGLHVSVANSILTETVFRNQSALGTALIILGFAFLLWLCAAVVPGARFTLACLGLYVVFYALHFALFVGARIVSTLAVPAVGFTAAVAALHLYRLSILQRDRNALLSRLAANEKLETVNRELAREKRKLEIASGELEELIATNPGGSIGGVTSFAPTKGSAPHSGFPWQPRAEGDATAPERGGAAALRPRNPEAFAEIVTDSQEMLSVFVSIEAFAGSSNPVLITGESGVGKELAAQAIHRLSGRKGKFVCENVAGLDDSMFTDTLFGHTRGAFTDADAPRNGLVQEAAAGTLFLDEIGDLPIAAQLKLLRFIEKKEYRPLGTDALKHSDARIVIATNADLAKKLADREFREDLFFRLTHRIHIPPLRERPKDLPLLIEHFVTRTCRTLGRRKPVIPAELVHLLSSYHFPGNVRELKNMIENALARDPAKTLSASYFERYVRAGSAEALLERDGADLDVRRISLSGRFLTLKEVEKTVVAEALRRTGGNQNLAARLLGLSPSALSRRISKGGIRKSL